MLIPYKSVCCSARSGRGADTPRTVCTTGCFPHQMCTFSSSLPRFVFVSGGAFYCFCLLHQCVKLVFIELFLAKPHVFLQKDHPLASKKVVSVHDLTPYPRLNFVQGEYESVYFSEELFSSIPVDKEIRVNDRGAIVNFMLGLNAYIISSGIFPKYLNGENIISVPLAENETMHIGYVLNENQELSELGKSYLEELRKYAPANQ